MVPGAGEVWSGAVYPSGWRIRVPEADLELEVEPLLADQEMDVFYQYWEGAVSVTGKSGEDVVSGMGYVELTGYAGSLEGEFGGSDQVFSGILIEERIDPEEIFHD